MSGRLWSVRLHDLLDWATRAVCGLLCFVWLPITAQAQERREREPNSVYAERRAKLATLADGPIVLWGFTGREEISQTYIFEQEENFYYLTGHNEEGAGLIILPTGQKRDTANIPSETLFLPAKNSQKEKWNGVRMSPTDPGIEARTGFATVKSFDSDFRIAVENLAKTFPRFSTAMRKSLSNDFTVANPVRASMPGSVGDMRTPFHFSFCEFFAGRKRVSLGMFAVSRFWPVGRIIRPAPSSLWPVR